MDTVKYTDKIDISGAKAEVEWAQDALEIYGKPCLSEMSESEAPDLS